MLLSEILATYSAEEDARTATDTALETLCEKIEECVRNFGIEHAGWGYAITRTGAPKGCNDKDTSIVPGVYGVQLALKGRMKHHSDQPLFGNVKIEVLSTNDRTFVRVTVIANGHPKMDDRFKEALTHYVLGVLGLSNNVEVIS